MSGTGSPTIDVRIAATIGLAAGGALGGLLGVGGGLIIVPGLVLVTRMERRLAHGTSLAATLPIALASVVTYGIAGNVDWLVALLIAGGAVCGAVLGTKLLTIVPVRALTIMFVVTVLVTAIRLFQSPEATGRASVTVATAGLLVLTGLLSGTLSGLLGIGGGIVMVPAMVVLFGIPPVLAKGTSVAVIVPTAITGTIRNRYSANVDLRVAGVLGVCGAGSAVIGGIVADGLSSDASNALFATLLVIVAATQLFSLRQPAH